MRKFSRARAFGFFVVPTLLLTGCFGSNPPEQSTPNSPSVAVSPHPCYDGLTQDQIENQNFYVGHPKAYAYYNSAGEIEFKTSSQISFQFSVSTFTGYYVAKIEKAQVTLSKSQKLETQFSALYVQGVDDQHHHLPRFNAQEAGRCMIFEAKTDPQSHSVGLYYLRDDGLLNSISLPKHFHLRDWNVFDHLSGNLQQLYFRISPSNTSKKICRSTGEAFDCLEVITAEDDHLYSISDFRLTRSGDLWIYLVTNSFDARSFVLQVPSTKLHVLDSTRVSAHIDQFSVAKDAADEPDLTPIGNSIVYRNLNNELSMINNGKSFPLNISYQGQSFQIDEMSSAHFDKCGEDLCVRLLSDPIFSPFIIHITEAGKFSFVTAND